MHVLCSVRARDRASLRVYRQAHLATLRMLMSIVLERVRFVCARSLLDRHFA